MSTSIAALVLPIGPWTQPYLRGVFRCQVDPAVDEFVGIARWNDENRTTPISIDGLGCLDRSNARALEARRLRSRCDISDYRIGTAISPDCNFVLSRDRPVGGHHFALSGTQIVRLLPRLQVGVGCDFASAAILRRR